MGNGVSRAVLSKDGKAACCRWLRGSREVIDRLGVLRRQVQDSREGVTRDRDSIVWQTEARLKSGGGVGQWHSAGRGVTFLKMMHLKHLPVSGS